MKMMKRTLLMAAAVLALAACSDDDGPDGPQLVTETVTFEDATLNTSGILTGEKLAEEVTGDMAGTIAPPEKVDAILSMRGYADGTLKKEVAFKLVDEEKGLVVDEWTNVDLTPLGWVDKIEFHFVCENVNAPAYFCIDDLTVATELNY